MSLTVQSFRPKFSITVHTWRGQTFDLTGDVVSWTTTKSLAQPQGQFVIQLTANKHNGYDWYYWIQPMDYVEIRASATGRTVNGELPIIMRGFVDSTSGSFNIGQQGGPTEPRIIIQGRDFSKLLLEWQILYLWEQNNPLQGAAGPTGMGLLVLLNGQVPMQNESLNALCHQLFDALVTKMAVQPVQSLIDAVPDLEAAFSFPDYETWLMTVASYSGSFWNLFSYLASPPFGELFVWDAPNGPQLVGRMTPYKTYDGVTPSPGKALEPTITIDQSEIQAYQFGRTDNDVYTYYLTWGDATVVNSNLGQAAYALEPGNGVPTSNANLYGTRPLIIDSPWLSPLSGAQQGKPNNNAFTQAVDMNKWLMAVMKDNPRFEQGTFTVHGHEKYAIGQYATLPQWGTEYYIAGVQHNYVQYQTWQTQLTVERGRPLGGSKVKGAVPLAN